MKKLIRERQIKAYSSFGNLIQIILVMENKYLLMLVTMTDIGGLMALISSFVTVLTKVESKKKQNSSEL
jgi:hypothetical protein